MGAKIYEESNIAAIAEKIREKTGGDKTYKPREMPEGVSEVFDAGIEQGKSESIDTIQKLIQHQVIEIDIPEGTTRLGAYCFAYCYNLKRVSIPDSVTLVDSGAFSGAGITGELVLPLYCSHYYNSALSSTKFTAMKLGNASVIQQSAFANNTQCLTYDFTRNTSIPTLDIRAFQNILPDAKILVPEHLYDEWVVATNWVEWADYIACPVSEGLCFEEGVNGGYAVLWGIDECADTTIIIPSTWNSLPVKEIVLLNGGYVDGMWASDLDVSHITTIKVPASVDYIYETAFKGCTSLTEVDFLKHTFVPALAGTAFEDVEGMKILVPSSLRDEWATATNWSYYGDKIVGV